MKNKIDGYKPSLFSSFIEQIEKKTKEYEFDSFAVVCKNKKRQGKIAQELSERFFATIDYKNPDLTIILKKEEIEIQTKTIYVYGRYNKLKRNISQTTFYCPLCHGRNKNCPKCKGKGRIIEKSVEEEITKHLKSFKAQKYIFHGAGREDFDVLMLGKGREFVVEIKNPKKRKIDLKDIEKEINKSAEIKVNNLAFCEKNKIKEIKEKKNWKKYRLIIECYKKPKEIKGEFVIYQRTPKRVKHRRADKERERKIKIVSFKQINEKKAEIILIAQHGTYIKEFISGDFGRTKNSYSEQTKNNCKCIELDVLDILD